MRSPTAPPTILTLPAEITELVLIFTAAGGFPTAISAFSQTCRVFRSLVYTTTDHHLWREVFLTTFDDPRHPGGQTSAEALAAKDVQEKADADKPFDWGTEFRCRVWTANYIRASTDGTSHPSAPTARSAACARDTLALDSLLSVVHSARPCPPTIVFSFLSPAHTTPRPGSDAASNPTYPIFPPQPHTLLSALRRPTPSASTPIGYLCSLNIPWFEAVLARGLPPALTALIAGPSWDGGLAGHLRTPHDARRMHAFGQLVAYTGFLPSPASAPDMSAAAQHARARRLARMRVYNMRYLARARHWGPFVRVDGGAPALYSEDEDVAEAEDKEDTAGPAEEDALPTCAQLRPDWAYLGAARIVVEANLREAVGAQELSGLVWLDGLRRGSAPCDTGAGGAPREDAVRSWRAAPDGDRGKGREIDHARDRADAVDGWDWAGVTGVWRRCVCWLDYRELVLQNLSSQFNDPRLQEAVRIVPMRLRAAWYSQSPVPAFAERPTIHVEGETSGSAAGGNTRTLRGTVNVVSDGSVRWTLYTAVDGGETDEWASEGVQMGNATSAMGVLGIWTSAQHERMDPIGPFWAWKVG
ncbi:hypothetical protein B0H21DRAFT_387623 [Amylocystis lapponica]|nr:hypothetical protein B0H21DRAFT_387623 [Amylocystis lapponica]